ncbi:MAG: hypothetical protein FJX23_10370, partial [Alphaproteobacteria bacterium]|nr:hypothetical protein [Alphaproteobacteria bacterium]
ALGDKINGLIDGVESAVKWFIALPDPIKDVIVYAVMLAAAIGPLTLIVGQIITGLGGLLMILSKIPMALGILAGGFKLLLGFGDLLAMGLLKLPKILFAIELAATGLFKVLFMNPIGLIITGIVALGVAAYMLIKHWDKVKTFFADLWDGIKTAFEDGVKGALAFLQPLIDGVEKVIGGIAKIGKRAGDAVKGGMNFVFGGDAPSGPRIGAAASPVGAAPLLSSQNGRIDAGGTLKIEVDDRRVRVAEAKPNDSRMQIRPAATGGIMEVY